MTACLTLSAAAVAIAQESGAEFALRVERAHGAEAWRAQPAARLIFDAGVGDSPGDWSLCHRDPTTDRLVAVAHTVTHFREAEEPEQEPHAVVHSDFATVSGVTLPMTWALFHWSEAKGAHGEPIGLVRVANLEFVASPPGAFARPTDAREDPLPGN